MAFILAETANFAASTSSRTLFSTSRASALASGVMRRIAALISRVIFDNLH
jgi:hypothetical protein